MSSSGKAGPEGASLVEEKLGVASGSALMEAIEITTKGVNTRKGGEVSSLTSFPLPLKTCDPY